MTLSQCSRPPFEPGKSQTGMHPDSTGQLWRWEGTGIATNTWFSGEGSPKSLILDASAATKWNAFAIKSPRFAMSSIFALALPAPLFSLSKSLTEKEKESNGEREMIQIAPPRVRSPLPSITVAAYFLCHESRASELPHPWKLMVIDSFEINALQGLAPETTLPRFALRVVRLHASLGK